jgi:hypothetical protein
LPEPATHFAWACGSRFGTAYWHPGPSTLRSSGLTSLSSNRSGSNPPGGPATPVRHEIFTKAAPPNAATLINLHPRVGTDGADEPHQLLRISSATWNTRSSGSEGVKIRIDPAPPATLNPTGRIISQLIQTDYRAQIHYINHPIPPAFRLLFFRVPYIHQGHRGHSASASSRH